MDNKCIYRLQPFKWFVLENFPFIEADFDSITNYQLLCKVVEYLNKTIDKTNELGNQVEALNNWFNNLDVQDEINNKLDEMAESGELEQIIERYLQTNTIYVYPTVADMKSSTALINGSTVRTLGYYEVNDGGGSLYTITNDGTLNTDEKFVILCQNSLKAKLIYNSEVSILQLGARSQKNNTRYDIHDYITKYIDVNEESERKFALFIPQGIFYTSPVEIVSENYKIYGVSTNSGKRKPTILSAWGNQEYIIKCGNSLNGSGYGTIENITFSSALYDDSYNRTSYYTISNACLVFNWVYYMTAEFLCFEYIVGTAFKISTSWELWISWLDFYHINAFGKGIFVFDEVMENVENGNLSDSSFNYLRFEQIIGNCIIFQNNCKGLNLHFGTINVEPSIVSDGGYNWGEYNSEVTIEDINSVIVINGQVTFIVDNIQLNNLFWRYHTINNLNYIFGDIIHITNNQVYQAIINAIALYFARDSVSLIKTIGNISDNPRSKITIGNVVNNSEHNMLLNVKDLSRIDLKSSIGGVNQNNNHITEYGAMIPCYKNIYNTILQPHGMINYNESAVNTEKLTIKSTNNLTSVAKRLFGFTYNSTSLFVRTKIAENETIDIAVYCYIPETDSYTNIGTATLTGTGVFARYEITLNNVPRLYGSIAYFQIVNNNESTIIEVDSFSN